MPFKVENYCLNSCPVLSCHNTGGAITKKYNYPIFGYIVVWKWQTGNTSLPYRVTTSQTFEREDFPSGPIMVRTTVHSPPLLY